MTGMRTGGLIWLLLATGTGTTGSNAYAQEAVDESALPIAFSYEILGNPIVGQPVAINLLVYSNQSEPIAVAYRILDGSSMTFPESQALEVEVTPSSEEVAASQQITVVPQREGRLYLNVSGSIETEAGPLIRATAIPIQVSRAPRPQQVDAEVGTDDELSSPADQN